MQPLRRARLGSVIHDELSQLIRGLKDPRIEPLTVTRVELTEDAGMVTVFFTILGGLASVEHEDQNGKPLTEEQREALYAGRVKGCLAGLTSASGFLRRNIATALTVRNIPELVFREDRGFENTTRVHELLKKIGVEPTEPTPPSNADD